MTWNTFTWRAASRPATAITRSWTSQPDIHSAAIGLEGVLDIRVIVRARMGDRRYRLPIHGLQAAIALG
jgi:hypothetical protein